MPHFSQLFGRKPSETPLDDAVRPADAAEGADLPFLAPEQPLPACPSAAAAVEEAEAAAVSSTRAPAQVGFALETQAAALSSVSVADLIARYGATGAESFSAASPAQETRRPDTERRPLGSLIGGQEVDLVPLIPDTAVDYTPPNNEPDEESSTQAVVEALMAASRVMVDRVKTLRQARDTTEIVSGLVTLANDLQARFAEDSGVVRGTAMEHVLREIRETVSEGDRFILESLETGRGTLTASLFLEDLRTIAPADRGRMIVHYVVFLIVLIQRVLRQYLQPLAVDAAQVRDVSRRLDHLIDGVRSMLLARVNPAP